MRVGYLSSSCPQSFLFAPPTTGPRSSCRHGKHPVPGHAGPETFWLTSCRIRTDTLDTSWNQFEWNKVVKNWFGFRTVSNYLRHPSWQTNNGKCGQEQNSCQPPWGKPPGFSSTQQQKQARKFASPICTFLRTNETPQRILFLYSAKQHIFQETLAQWTIEPKTNHIWNGIYNNFIHSWKLMEKMKRLPRPKDKSGRCKHCQLKESQVNRSRHSRKSMETSSDSI